MEDISIWIWILVGFGTLIAMSYGGLRVIRAARKRWRENRRNDFRGAVVDVVQPMVDPLSGQLDKLHDCLDRVGVALNDHIESDAKSFEKTGEDTAHILLMLQNLQAGQAPHS